MKLLIITVIVLVIPGFFVLVFAMSTVGKLTGLRNRCREVRARIQSAPGSSPLTGPAPDVQTQADFTLAVERYDAARRQFPANLLATLCGFREMESLQDQQANVSRETR